MTGARYGQELRRALKRPQKERLMQRQPAQADSVAASPPAGSSFLRRRALITR